MPYLSIGNDAKTIKGEAQGVITAIMYLAPGKESGQANLCAHASWGCLAACLFTSGMGATPNVKADRIARTRRFLADIPKAVQDIKKEIGALIRKAQRENMTPAVRFNGTSDLPFENLFPMGEYPNVHFYDYTKNPLRMIRFLEGKMPANYHLTFSLSETNREIAKEILKRGGNVAAVFATDKPERFPKTWEGYKVINGDESDIRFRDEAGCVVGLKSKGKAKKDTSGFVQPIE